MNKTSRRQSRVTRHKRIRAKLSGTTERPRLTVFRSSKHLHMQIVDDTAGRTLASASTVKDKDPVKTLTEQTTKLGIKNIVFDRGGYQYHGKIAKLADDLRKAGLIF